LAPEFDVHLADYFSEGASMLETPILAALGLVAVFGFVWWLYRSG